MDVSKRGQKGVKKGSKKGQKWPKMAIFWPFFGHFWTPVFDPYFKVLANIINYWPLHDLVPVLDLSKGVQKVWKKVIFRQKWPKNGHFWHFFVHFFRSHLCKLAQKGSKKGQKRSKKWCFLTPILGVTFEHIKTGFYREIKANRQKRCVKKWSKKWSFLENVSKKWSFFDPFKNRFWAGIWSIFGHFWRFFFVKNTKKR